jgi:uracil-DNA glycosylase
VHNFDPGYGRKPFFDLVRDYPGADVYPPEKFRVEWGPLFHRGRLDGRARILVLGQDPAQHESIVRRVLVGEAGQRVQGFLAKLGVMRSYVMINTFLYSLFGSGGTGLWDDEGIVEYRHRWLDALLVATNVEAVVAVGSLAGEAFSLWRQEAGSDLPFERLIHPTFPEASSGGDPVKYAAAMQQMLDDWNAALQTLSTAIEHPDEDVALVPYGSALEEGDLAPIPELDMPAGLPPWMRSLRKWAEREGATTELKRATIVVRIPEDERPWLG